MEAQATIKDVAKYPNHFIPTPQLLVKSLKEIFYNGAWSIWQGVTIIPHKPDVTWQKKGVSS